MIGCIIVGGLAALGIASIARRHHRGWGCGGRWRRGGCGTMYGGGDFPSHEDAWGDLGSESRGGHDRAHAEFDWGGHGGNPLLFRHGRRFILRGVLRRLETTPTQERALRDAAREFRDSAQSLKGEARRSRADVAAELRRPAIDENVLGELFARHDGTLDSVRKAFVGLMIKVHEILDDTQRERLAQLVELGPRWFRSPMTTAW
jgi:hypothetical protein